LNAFLWQACDSGHTNSVGPNPPPPDNGGKPTDSTTALSDEELMDLVQQKTFNYFWDGAEPNSGLALERSNGSSTLITIGGSGMGLASFPAAVERGWITRKQAIDRLQKILSFLEKVPTYHGAFSHWYNGATAKTVPFSKLDDGGDLVETALLMQGLLINRQYFDSNSQAQQEIRKRITTLWKAVEWRWYQQEDEKVLT